MFSTTDSAMSSANFSSSWFSAVVAEAVVETSLSIEVCRTHCSTRLSNCSGSGGGGSGGVASCPAAAALGGGCWLVVLCGGGGGSGGSVHSSSRRFFCSSATWNCSIFRVWRCCCVWCSALLLACCPVAACSGFCVCRSIFCFCCSNFIRCCACCSFALCVLLFDEDDLEVLWLLLRTE